MRIAVFSGAGVSAESGIPTFRDSDGLWHRHDLMEVASIDGWRNNPGLVLEFYNERRSAVAAVEPNAAHHAITRLEQSFETVVITQNIDDLHERAGSTNVIHLHGEITKARSSLDPTLVEDIGYQQIKHGDKCERGSQLRPHIVWFGEEIFRYEESMRVIARAEKILVVGTSLSVFPAAGLLQFSAQDAEKVVIAPELEEPPEGYQWIREKATVAVPQVVEDWIGA